MQLLRKFDIHIPEGTIQVGCRPDADSCSGIVDTPMVAKSFATRGEISTSHTAMNRRGKPEEIADLIAFLLSDRSTFITGAIYSIDGGWNC